MSRRKQSCATVESGSRLNWRDEVAPRCLLVTSTSHIAFGALPFDAFAVARFGVAREFGNRPEIKDWCGDSGICALWTGSGFAALEKFGHRVLDELT